MRIEVLQLDVFRKHNLHRSQAATATYRLQTFLHFTMLLLAAGRVGHHVCMCVSVCACVPVCLSVHAREPDAKATTALPMADSMFRVVFLLNAPVSGHQEI